MEHVNILATLTMAFLTFIGVGSGIATIILQFTTFRGMILLTIVLFYILIILLFVMGARRKLI